MLVDECADGKIQQHYAAREHQRALRTPAAHNGSPGDIPHLVYQL